MKNTIPFILCCTLILCLTTASFAQSPKSFNYQAVVRDGGGSAISSQPVSFRITLIQSEMPVYAELHQAQTSPFGLVNLQIGSGTSLLNDLSDINWGTGAVSIKMEVDPEGGSNYTVGGVSNLLSVPYALYSENSGFGSQSLNTIEDWGLSNNDIYTVNSGNVGIGTSNPGNKLTVDGTIQAGNLFVHGGDLVTPPTEGGSYMNLFYNQGSDIGSMYAFGNGEYKSMAFGDMNNEKPPLFIGTGGYLGVNWDIDEVDHNLQVGGNGYIETGLSIGTYFESYTIPSNGLLVQGKVGIGISIPDELLHVGGNMRLNGTFEDKDGEAGACGQILSSTGTGTEWIDAPINTGSLLPTGGDWSLCTNLNIDSNTLVIDQANNRVGIGTTNIPQSTLAVNGKITAQEVEVTSSGWADYVFDDDFELKPLKDVEKYIKANNHLPDVPSESEVLENGINLGEMDAILLQKIEELTLYVIQLKNENEALKDEFQKRISSLEKLNK
ncbi:hypothetical protein ACFLSY_10470 [Bacteroidota bacterium]